MSSIAYASFDQIPNETELQRMWRLQDAALRKCADAPELLTDEEIHVITIMGSADEGRKARRSRNQALLAAEKKYTKVAAPAAPGALEWDQRTGEDEATWRKRIGRFPAKVWMVFEAVEAVWKFIEEMNTKNAERNEKIGALESRLAAIEQRPALKFCGPHREGHAYAEGSLTQRGGGLWLAERTTTETPGSPDSGFRLIVKSREG